jgi:hypothetical protein
MHQAVYGTQELNMTAEEFAEAIDKLVAAARDSGLSDAKMIVVLEDIYPDSLRTRIRLLRISFAAILVIA